MLTTLAGATGATLLLLLKATLLLGAAFAISVALQRASAGTRHLVWLATLATLLMMPALAAWAPWRLEILPATPLAPAVAAPAADAAAAARETSAANATSVPAPAATNLVVQSTATMPAPGVASPSAPASSASSASRLSRGVGAWLSSLSLGGMLLLVWGVVALAIVGWLARGALAVRHIVRNARPLDTTPEWRMPLWEVADRLELPEVPRLLVSDEARMPFACGLRHPTVVFPRSCESWSLDRRQAVLLHELAHVKRRDLLGHTLGRLACALWWFHPLMWTAAKRLRAESERACDDLALASGARASDYAEHLLDIVASVRGDATPSVALAMARRREFEGRMLAILDPRLHRAAPSRRQAAAVVASVAMLAVLVGAAAPAQRRAEVVDASSPVATPRVDDAARRLATPDGEARLVLAGRDTDVVAPSRDPLPDADEAQDAQPEQETALDQDAQPDQASQPSSVQAVVRQGMQTGLKVGMDAAGAAIDGLLQQADGRKDDERARLLAGILARDSSASLRRLAAWGLAQHDGDEAAASALATALRRDASVEVREMAAWALASTHRAQGAAEAVRAALRDQSPKVRATAAWTLASIGDRESVDALAAVLGDSSETVRYRAAWAIGSLGPRTAPPQLVALLKDPEAQVRRATAWALFVIEDPATADALDQAFRVEKEKDVQMSYVRALAAMGDRSIEPLKKLLESSDPEIRATAVRALAGGRAGGPWPWPMPMPRPHP